MVSRYTDRPATSSTAGWTAWLSAPGAARQMLMPLHLNLNLMLQFHHPCSHHKHSSGTTCIESGVAAEEAAIRWHMQL